MAVYIILIISILLIPLFDRSKSWESKKSKLLTYKHFVLLYMISIPGFRAVSIGLDTSRYECMFRDYAVEFNALFRLGVRTEEGYLILNKIVHDITDSFVCMQLAVAILCLVPAYWLSSKYSSKHWLSLLFIVVFIFYYTCFNEMRLSIALGISCLSFYNIVQGDWKNFLFFTTLAFFFHHTSIIILPLILVIFIKKIDKWHLVLLAFGYFAISNFMLYLFSFLNSMHEIEYSIQDTTGGYGLLILQLFTITLVFVRRKYLLYEKYNLYAFYYICTSIIMFPILHTNPTMFRLGQYTWLPMIILVPNLISSFQKKPIQFVMSSAYFLSGFLFLFLHSFSEKNQIIPYKFFWE